VGRSAQRILCVGPEIRDKAVARLAPRNRTEVFVNGIDTSRFGARRPGERESARAALDIAPGQTVLLLFAWDWHRKGGTLLLETVLELRRRGSEVLALVVTTDSEAELQVRRLGLETSVRVIAPRDDARQLYIAADLFISPSTAEGMPFAVLEALASGTPVIASNIPSHRFVADQLSACCVVERDPRSFASAIEAELARDHEARRACLHRGRREIEAKYSLSHWSERLVELYSELLEEVR
jgi:glycosyltransferase involved in cell wall biosynthesis